VLVHLQTSLYSEVLIYTSYGHENQDLFMLLVTVQSVQVVMEV
jgi:hypothetical protein